MRLALHPTATRAPLPFSSRCSLLHLARDPVRPDLVHERSSLGGKVKLARGLDRVLDRLGVLLQAQDPHAYQLKLRQGRKGEESKRGEGIAYLEDGGPGRAPEKVHLRLASVGEQLASVRVLVLQPRQMRLTNVRSRIEEWTARGRLRTDQNLLHLVGRHSKQLAPDIVEPRQPDLTGVVQREHRDNVSEPTESHESLKSQRPREEG